MRDVVERSFYIYKKTNKLRVRLLIELSLVCPTSLCDVALAREVLFSGSAFTVNNSLTVFARGF